jgi:signal transduction histidine kinase
VTSSETSRQQRIALAAHIGGRREAILRAWRRAVEADPGLTTASTLTRRQFYDHVPHALAGLQRELSASEPGRAADAAEDQREAAAGHGLLRWQQGYQLTEAMREWRHFHLCLVEELEAYAAEHPDLEPDVMPAARGAVARLCSDGVCESADEYLRLNQAEAAGRMGDLESALTKLQELERERARLWHEAVHDLRGNVGVVKNVATLLDRTGLSPEDRERSTDILKRGVASLTELLEDLLSLARLEAGQERRQVAAFDAAKVFKDLCTAMQPIADARGLFLRADGPAALPVEGDAVKTRRVAQNLLLNALRYTPNGGVILSWSAGAAPDAQTWVFNVQDTGPGFSDDSVTPIAQALNDATREGTGLERRDDRGAAPPPPTLPSASSHRSAPQPSGEGIGLSIVKRLCEILDATLELETRPGRGSTFRVTLPRRLEPRD